MKLNFLEALERRRIESGVKGAVNALFAAESRLCDVFETEVNKNRLVMEGYDRAGMLKKLHSSLAAGLVGYIARVNISERRELSVPEETLSFLVHQLVRENGLDVDSVYRDLIEFGMRKFMEDDVCPLEHYKLCVCYLKSMG